MKPAVPALIALSTLAGCGHGAATAAPVDDGARMSLAPSHPVASEIVGSLDEGDLVGGEDACFYDEYPIELRAGWSLHVVLRSEAFDTYLAVMDADGNELVDNDDDATLGGNGLDSQLTFTAVEAGAVAIRVTSYSGGETGEYRLAFEAGPDVPPAMYSDEYGVGDGDGEMECCEGDPGEDYEDGEDGEDSEGDDDDDDD